MSTQAQPLRLLTFTTLYPNATAPNHGVFVENRLRALLATGEATSLVLAPVPYFPSTHPRFGAYARLAAVPRAEKRFDIDIIHPRFLALPRANMHVAPFLLYAAAAPAFARLLRAGHRFDLIDAHYLYPDGVAATWLGRRFNLPVVLTARGSDVTELPNFALPRALIGRAASGADAIITVSAGLRAALAKLGISGEHVTVLRNGVDLQQFAPCDRDAARAELGLSGPTLLAVGALIPRKGHALTIAAMTRLPAWRLLIAGEGPEREDLAALAARLGVADRVVFLGAWPHADLARLYSAADISVLASEREGWANVLLESMACGTPVIASPIPGNDEVVRDPAAGRIATDRTPEAIATAIRALAASAPDRAATRAYAANFGWDMVSQGQLDLFRRVLAIRRHES
ncbi:MAG TPA: glycosyltransferase [Acetobacteraceae bacterium]|nr:glycosyltransferase [Acetobacteraceae bacterium]